MRSCAVQATHWRKSADGGRYNAIEISRGPWHCRSAVDTTNAAADLDGMAAEQNPACRRKSLKSIGGGVFNENHLPFKITLHKITYLHKMYVWYVHKSHSDIKDTKKHSFVHNTVYLDRITENNVRPES